MKHGIRAYWRGCRCNRCRAANARYFRIRRFNEPRDYYVPIRRAQQLLMQFEDAADAARVLKISKVTAWSIRTGAVKKIRRSTELKITDRAA